MFWGRDALRRDPKTFLCPDLHRRRYSAKNALTGDEEESHESKDSQYQGTHIQNNRPHVERALCRRDLDCTTRNRQDHAENIHRADEANPHEQDQDPDPAGTFGSGS